MAVQWQLEDLWCLSLQESSPAHSQLWAPMSASSPDFTIYVLFVVLSNFKELEKYSCRSTKGCVLTATSLMGEQRRAGAAAWLAAEPAPTPHCCITSQSDASPIQIYSKQPEVFCAGLWLFYWGWGGGRGDKMPFWGQLIAEEMDSFLFSCFLNCWVRGEKKKKKALFPTRGEKQSETLSGL